MHQTKITIILVMLVLFTIGNLASGSLQGALVMGCVLLIFTYLAFVARAALKMMHFLIGRYITISGIAVGLFLIFSPIIQEISGGFGDLRTIVSGMIIFFPTLVLREAIIHRMKGLLAAEVALTESPPNLLTNEAAQTTASPSSGL